MNALIAVAGTLCGGLLGSWMQARLARTARQEARGDTRRAEALAAVTALVSALADHRRAMWVREEARLAGADPGVVADARTASHATRAEVTGPLVMVSILAPTLARPARQAEQASYALRGAADHEALVALRDRAVNAADLLIESARQALTPQVIVR